VNNQPEVVGTKEAANQLGVSVRTVQLWVEKGTLQAWKTDGGHRRILKSSVEAALDSRTHARSNSTSNTTSIVVVEDDPTVQSYYIALFEILCPDALITVVGDGYDALIELGKSQPELLLVDVNLPQMDGITLLHKLVNSNVITDIKIAVVTGLSSKQLEARGEIQQSLSNSLI